MIFKYILIGIVAICAPFSISRASQLSFEVMPQKSGADSVTVIEVFLDPQGVSVNAIEGTIGLLGAGAEHLSTVVIETGESALNYWPQYPEYSLSEHVIRFTGGTTESFSEKRSLFKMRIFAERHEELVLSWLGGSAYRGDGEGTEEAISSRSLTTVVTKSEPNQISPASVDTKPPQFDEVRVSQDEDVYDGKYFLSFHAVDDISGVVGYEVVEGNETTRVDNGVYLFNDQERNVRTIIIAYDGAGNSTSVKAPTKYEWLSKVVWGGVGIFLMLAVLYWCVRRNRRAL